MPFIITIMYITIIMIVMTLSMVIVMTLSMVIIVMMFLHHVSNIMPFMGANMSYTMQQFMRNISINLMSMVNMYIVRIMMVMMWTI